jgi:AraC family transcriptional regulator
MNGSVGDFSIGAALLRSRAMPRRAASLPGGAWFVHWRNADTETEYLKPEHHTLSFYLEGGHAVRCRDQPAARGAPGSLCCLPAGHESRWDVRGSLQLLHLYLPRLELAQAAERWFEIDPRSATLAERIYFHDDTLAALCRSAVALDWSDRDAALALQQIALDLQAQLLGRHSVPLRPLPALRGGLSPGARRRVLERVETGLAGDLGLADLAAAAGLSEFHFARMFKASFGMGPHAWVMRRRLEHARQLLAAGRLGPVEVALRAGYAHPSHLNAALRRAGLATAAAYRERHRACAVAPRGAGWAQAGPEGALSAAG